MSGVIPAYDMKIKSVQSRPGFANIPSIFEAMGRSAEKGLEEHLFTGALAAYVNNFADIFRVDLGYEVSHDEETGNTRIRWSAIHVGSSVFNKAFTDLEVAPEEPPTDGDVPEGA